MKLSVVIPAYNEAKDIVGCLESLADQTIPFQLVLVDDGSTDQTKKIIKAYEKKFTTLLFLESAHQGPASARNLGAASATGDMFVFVDADMTFDSQFLKDLTKPITEKKAKGTFTKNEYVGNWDNALARCWNYNLNLPDKKRLPANYPDEAPVFRALLASEFKKVGGFTPGIGWTDDWTLSRKLGYKSVATSAVCYHMNPSTLADVFKQAKWMGKNEYMTGNSLRVLYSLARHSPPMTFFNGFFKSMLHKEPHFYLFKIIYDLGITLGILSTLIGSHKNK